MNNLLLFFALPIATIIIAAVLERCVCHSPCAIGALALAIFLIVTYVFFDSSFLIFALIYTVLAYLSALITRFIRNLLNDNDTDDTSNENCNGSGCSCGCGRGCGTATTSLSRNCCRRR